MSDTQQSAPPGQLVIANILPTLTSMPAVLQENRIMAQKANEVSKRAIEACSNSERITADQDERLQKLILQIKQNDVIMKEKRSSFTQFMTLISTEFTAVEKEMNDYAAQLQSLRNRRAREVAEDEKKRKEEAARVAAKNKERADIEAHFTTCIANCISTYKFKLKSMWDEGFAGITLENFEEKQAKLSKIKGVFPAPVLDTDVLKFDNPAALRHTPEEIAAIRTRIRGDYDFATCATAYVIEMDDYLRKLRDRLPSKLQELQEAKRLQEEQVRLQEEQRQAAERKKELDRQAAQTRNAAEQERLRKEQETLAESQRQLDRDREQSKKEQERIQQEQADRQRLQDEENERQRLAQVEKDQQAGEMARSKSVAGTLFEQVKANATVTENAPETRTSVNIRVVDYPGYALIFQAWFLSDEPKKMWDKDPEKLENMTLGRMKAFAEKQAPGTKIESELLVYDENYTAVNRKEKKDKK